MFSFWLEELVDGNFGPERTLRILVVGTFGTFGFDEFINTGRLDAFAVGKWPSVVAFVVCVIDAVAVCIKIVGPYEVW